MQINFEWENLKVEKGPVGYRTQRAKVIGGWLIKNISWDSGDGIAVSESMVFIQDPEHLWKI